MVENRLIKTRQVIILCTRGSVFQHYHEFTLLNKGTTYLVSLWPFIAMRKFLTVSGLWYLQGVLEMYFRVCNRQKESICYFTVTLWFTGCVWNKLILESLLSITQKNWKSQFQFLGFGFVFNSRKRCHR